MQLKGGRFLAPTEKIHPPLSGLYLLHHAHQAPGRGAGAADPQSDGSDAG